MKKLSQKIDENFLHQIMAKNSLHEFLKQAWPQINGAPFASGWHIEAMCEHLEALYRGEIKNLLINIPPRCSKSIIVSIVFPAWVWLQNPSEKFLCASYVEKLSNTLSSDFRKLIQSQWYKRNWDKVFSIEENTKEYLSNDKHGSRLAVSIGGAVMGLGGNILICDDPNDPDDRDSKIQRENTLKWYKETWSTRMNDEKTGHEIVVQQRIAEGDISGYIIANDQENNWTKLILPMEFESSRRCKTYISGELFWEDPREEEGDLLWPEKKGIQEVAALKRKLSSEYVISSQLQQIPSPKGGGLIKVEWLKKGDTYDYSEVNKIIQSWDISDLGSSDIMYAACTTWGLLEGHVILLATWEGDVTYTELLDRIERLHKNYKDTEKEKSNKHMLKSSSYCLLDYKYNHTIFNTLQHKRISAWPLDHKPENKDERVALTSNWLKEGKVKIGVNEQLTQTFLSRCVLYPNAEHNNIVYSMGLFLAHLQKINHFSNRTPYVSDFEIPYFKKKDNVGWY